MPSRKSLLLCALALAGLCSGCIVSEPPEYDPPGRSPIILDLVNAQPLVTRIIVVPQGEARPQIDFNVPLRSEDSADDGVGWAVHANYGLPQGFVLRNGQIPPGTIKEERSIAFSLRSEHLRGLSAGCHQLTLVVGHLPFWIEDQGEPDPERAPIGDAALAVWYLNMHPEPLQANDLLNCPSPDQVEF
ncbi:MAG TPA: hypothetical protein VER33_28395 [Polyangiaceae bacterium]|nr:hypothetical protein [Polyangiaceae bacterium]